VKGHGGGLAILLLLGACTTTIDAAHEPGIGTIINPNCLAFCKYEQGTVQPPGKAKGKGPIEIQIRQ